MLAGGAERMFSFATFTSSSLGTSGDCSMHPNPAKAASTGEAARSRPARMGQTPWERVRARGVGPRRTRPPDHLAGIQSDCKQGSWRKTKADKLAADQGGGQPTRRSLHEVGD